MFGKKKVIIECPLSHEVRTETRKVREAKIFEVFTDLTKEFDKFLFESLTNKENYGKSGSTRIEIEDFIAIEVYTMFSSYYAKKGYRTNYDTDYDGHAIFRLEWDST